MLRRVLVGLMMGMVVAVVGVHAAGSRPPEGQLTLGLSFTIAPAYLDPSEATQVIASAFFLYALHDALIKSLPGNPMAPALAESWTESPDGLVYEFILRQGLTFHNGDPFTAEDVHYSFGRYKGVSAKLLRAKVKAVEVIDAHREVHPAHIKALVGSLPCNLIVRKTVMDVIGGFSEDRAFRGKVASTASAQRPRAASSRSRSKRRKSKKSAAAQGVCGRVKPKAVVRAAP